MGGCFSSEFEIEAEIGPELKVRVQGEEAKLRALLGNGDFENCSRNNHYMLYRLWRAWFFGICRTDWEAVGLTIARAHSDSILGPVDNRIMLVEPWFPNYEVSSSKFGHLKDEFLIMLINLKLQDTGMGNHPYRRWFSIGKNQRLGLNFKLKRQF